ncbi:hypothetical protein [Endothiovibrio diazotrophicus]
MKSYRGKRLALWGLLWVASALPLAQAYAYRVIVSPTSGLMTDEDGRSDTFVMMLDAAPNNDVTMTVSSSDPSEGEALPVRLTFTPDNWNQPQTVTVTGQGDSLGDGDQSYVVFTRETVSDDPRFDGLDPDDVTVTNIDTTRHFVVSTISGSTTEAGGTATFTVALGVPPSADVTIPLSSSNTAEGLLSIQELTFTAANWSVPQTVTVTGVGDELQDGDQSYTIQLEAATSADPAFSGRDPDDVAVVNLDTTHLRIVTSTISGETTEAGGSATFTVVLTVAPTADVTIPLSSSNIEEGMVSEASVTFTTADWDIPQTVTVIGVSDATADGDRTYEVILGPAVSDDPDYSGVDAGDVTVVNTEQATSRIVVSAISGATDEGGAQATFTVVLNREPLSEVVMILGSSDPGEGTVSPSRLTFSPVNWSVPQTVTVTGALDLLEDGDQAYIVEFSSVTSSDPAYDGQSLAGVAVINRDRAVLSGRTVAGGELLDGVLLRGTIVNHGTLNDVRVLGGGVVEGGTLSGTISNSGTVRNVTLAAGTRVEGGTIGGTVTGVDEVGTDLPVVDGAVEEGASLSYVTLGENATLGEGAVLGRGVHFATNDMVPEGLDVAALLPALGGGGLYADTVPDLSTDVVARGASGADPIIHSLNNLAGISDSGLLLSQDVDSGLLSLGVGSGYIVLRPVTVVQAAPGTPEGITIDERGRYLAVTADGRRVTLEPTLKSPAAFTAAVAAMWPAAPVAGEAGVLSVALDEQSHMALLPGLVVSPAPATDPTGVFEEEHPAVIGSTVLLHRFNDSLGRHWEQRLYPAALPGMATAVAELSSVSSAAVDYQGVLHVSLENGDELRALPSMAVSDGEPTPNGAFAFESAGDVDGDGIDDFLLTAGDGSRQEVRLLLQ